MPEFIQLLKQRYQTILSQSGRDASKILYQQRIDQLILAEAFMRKGQLLAASPKKRVHIAVIGPTQVGKSSLVNVLLNTPLAGVSPLAGYTMHPQGFCQGLSLADSSVGLQNYFGRFQQLQPEQLTKTRHDCYSITENFTVSTLLPDCIVWDTPDFDSIDSATYREGVIRTMALADIIILVVSKEKYADQSVWDMMTALEPLHQPTFICLNKLSQGSENLLIPSLTEKWQHARRDKFPVVIPLTYQKQTALPLWPEALQSLLINCANALNQRDMTAAQSRFEQGLLQKYWHSWLMPVVEEHQQLSAWQQLIDDAIQHALAHYQRDYLNHPQHYETFQQALAELLTLLEIPGLAGLMTGARKALTWPVRQLLKLGRKRLHLADSSHELALLNQIAEHALIQLADKLLDNAEQHTDSAWWKDFTSVLRRQRGAILQNFSAAAIDYHVNFQQDVEKTAQLLYHKLQQQPVVLNSLRATRTVADAAAIALTLHTGGIGMHDLVIAPAMLSVTSLLTESAIGSYIHSVENQLKQQQLNTVKQALFIDNLGQQLSALSEQLTPHAYFNISPQQLSAAERHLTEKRHGLRLL